MAPMTRAATRRDKSARYGSEWLRRTGSQFTLYLVLTVLAIVFLLPMYWMLNISLQPEGNLRLSRWYPNPPDFTNYPEALNQKSFPFLRLLANSLTYALGSTVGILFSCSMVGYSFARLRWPGRNLLFIITLSTMMIPGTVTLIPTFLVFRWLGWTGSMLPLIVPGFFGSPFNIFLLRQFFMTIPNELSEAAIVDGASHWTILLRVVVPLAKPALAVVALFTMMWAWNEYLEPLIYINDPQLFPIALGLQNMRASYTNVTRTLVWPYLMAASTATILPALVLFFFTQRTFIEGITVTGIKG